MRQNLKIIQKNSGAHQSLLQSSINLSTTQLYVNESSAPETTDAIKAPMYHITKYNSVLHVV